MNYKKNCTARNLKIDTSNYKKVGAVRKSCFIKKKKKNSNKTSSGKEAGASQQYPKTDEKAVESSSKGLQIVVEHI